MKQLTPGPLAIQWEDLIAATYHFHSPFVLELEDKSVFTAEKIARILPKKRLVAFGQWQGKSVVAKLFFHAKHAKKHMEKDKAGVLALHKNKIPTAEILYTGVSPDNRIYIVIFERMLNAKSLDEIYKTNNNMSALMPLLLAVTEELATQHVLGILQHDLHLKNFLLVNNIPYTVDGDQIEVFPTLLSKQQSMQNLALFLSQLGVGLEAYQLALFKHYAKSRSWIMKADDVHELFRLIKKWNASRWRSFEKKIFRDSSSYGQIHHNKIMGMYDRSYLSAEMRQFLQDPEMAFHHPTMKILKNGRSATVIHVRFNDQDLVIKRYNLKNYWHRIRRSVRPTRAAVCWRTAHKLKLFGIATAKPVAFIESRLLGFRGKAYYVTEHVAGMHAGDFFNHYPASSPKIRDMVPRITALLKNIAKLEITHGDLKITNILIDENENPLLIDLDGTSEHISLAGLRSAWHKEIKRFMENFRQYPSIAEKFKTEFNSNKQ